MTVQSGEPFKVEGSGDGNATEFSASTMVFYENDDVFVTHVATDGVETLLEEGSGASKYSVALTAVGAGSTGFNAVVTYPADEVTPMATGEKIVIKRVLAFEQDLDVENQGGYFPDLVEAALDKLTYLHGQQQEELDRTVKVTIGSEDDPDALVASIVTSEANAAASATAASSSATSASDSATAASDDADDAAASAAALEVPDPAVADTYLRRNAGNTTYEAKTVAQVQADLSGTSEGDLVRLDATGLPAVDGSQLTGIDISLPRSYLAGLTLSIGTDTAHDIDIAAGEARGSDDDEDIALSAITKQIDATWASGDDAGGLSSSLTAPANDTWYHVFAINVGGSADVGFDTSITAANLVADHSATAYRRIGSVLTDGSANIIAFLQVGDEFIWVEPPTDFASADPGASEVTTALTVPTGLSVLAKIVARNAAASNGRKTHYYHPDVTGDTVVGQGIGQASADGTVEINIRTDASAQVQHISVAEISSMTIWTHGWADDRGRND